VEYDYAIIGGGIAGISTFYYLSKLGSTILIDKNSNKHYSLCKLFPKHNFQWIPDDLDLKNKDIFVRNNDLSKYASKLNEAEINANEFDGKSMGKVVDQYNFIQWHLREAIKSKGEILWDHKVNQVNIFDNSVKINTESREIIAKIVIIATGSSDFTIQKSLGFKTPEKLNVIISTFKGSEKLLSQNISEDYIFRIHPDISRNGPLVMTRARNYFNIGYLSKESKDEMATKLMRILKNYQPIQKYFTGIEKQLQDVSKDDFQFNSCSKHLIPEMINNRIIVIGEAAGAVTSFYYEGIVGSVISARTVYDTIKKIEKGIINSNYSKEDLIQYENLLKSRIKNYFQSGNAAENMFLKSGSNWFSIWDTFVTTLKKNSKVRKNVYTAFIYDDLGNYPLKNDEWVGEQIFKNLPFGKKIALTPFFLKLKFS
jgi:flavin-dependent dehydrogenase